MQLRDYESNYQHMKNQQENVQMELEQSKLQCTQLTSELGKSHFNYFAIVFCFFHYHLITTLNNVVNGINNGRRIDHNCFTALWV
jgi:hypothetical protein